MGKKILSGIVKVEKEIRERLAAETKKEEERLSGLKEEVEAEIRREEESLAASLEKALEKAGADAQKESLAIVEKAEARAAGLAAISEETLERVVLEHLLTGRAGEAP